MAKKISIKWKCGTRYRRKMTEEGLRVFHDPCDYEGVVDNVDKGHHERSKARKWHNNEVELRFICPECGASNNWHSGEFKEISQL